MPQTYHFIINSRAGAYTPDRAAGIVRNLESRGISPAVSLVTEPGEAAQHANRICSTEENPLIIVGGGDGTINGVVNGLTFGKATLAVVPLGTANILANELGISTLEDAVERIRIGATRFPAVGLLQGEKKKQFFLLMAGVGFDGIICESVRPSEKSILGKGAYLLAALRCFAAWQRESLQIFVDEMRIDCHSIIVCNTPHYGGGALLAPDADLFAPEFQLVCVKDDRRRSYLRLIANTLAKRYPDIPEVRRLFADKLVITGKKAVQVDGDFITYSPVRISCVERLFQLIV